MIYFVLLLAAVIVSPIVAIFWLSARESRAATASHEDDPNFTPDYTLDKGTARLSIDAARRILRFSVPNLDLHFSPDEILSVEIQQDGDTITRTSAGSLLGRAAAGGLVFGGAGALLGGLSAKKQSKTLVHQVRLIIRTSSLDTPMLGWEFLAVETQSGSFLHTRAAENAAAWHARLEAFMALRDRTDPPPTHRMDASGMIR